MQNLELKRLPFFKNLISLVLASEHSLKSKNNYMVKKL